MLKNSKRIHLKIVKGLLEFIILQFISSKPMHGYQLIIKIRKTFGTYFGPSTIYPLLITLEESGYVKSEWNDLKCLFIGEGPMLRQLKKISLDLDVEKMCIFAGVRNNIELIYPLLTLFVLPSIREPFGLVLLEAMASGVTVLSPDSGGQSEFIKSGINGVLVPPRDPKSLASQINWILSNKEKAEEIGQEGLRTVETHFDVKGTARKIGEVYFSINKKGLE